MNEVNIFLDEFEVQLRVTIEKAQNGDEQAINQLNMLKEWLNDY